MKKAGESVKARGPGRGRSPSTGRDSGVAGRSGEPRKARPAGEAGRDREGGKGAAAPAYELTGGALCLDLANTVDSRPTSAPVEKLRSCRDLIAWAVQAGVVSPRRGRLLEEEAAARPRKGRALLARARELREALFDLFAAAADGRPRPGAALETLNSMIPGALAGLEIAPAAEGYGWSWRDEALTLDGLLGPVVDSACELLASERLSRVRRCEAERCDWLFVDTSRNRSRRWCDMSVCGNRAKARRHYRRSRAGG